MRIVDSDILLYRNRKERFLDANFNIHKRLTNNGKLLNIIEYSKSLNKEENLVNYNDKVLDVTCNDWDDILVFDVENIFKDGLNVSPIKLNVLKVTASAYNFSQSG